MSVTFATSCWEKDWQHILLAPGYLKTLQIAHHLFPFSERLLIINNVSDVDSVKRATETFLEEGVLTRVVDSRSIEGRVMSFFQLKRSDFKIGADAHLYSGVNPDWIYYNALAPLSAIYSCSSDYLLYLTGDVRLDEPLDWIGRAIGLMKKDSRYKVANPTWNYRYLEAKAQAEKKRKSFYISSQGFSDQLFLVRAKDFQAPIYGEIWPEASHFPRGDVFEKRVFSAMKSRGWLRLTYAKGSYVHENFSV